ncbi:MAG: hemoblobin-interacting domain-containing protein [Desulfitobacteriaceae bacterium]
MKRCSSNGVQLLLSLLFCLLVLGSNYTFNIPIVEAEESISVAKLDAVQGSVFVKRGGGYRESQGSNGMLLGQGDSVRTGLDGTAKIIFDSVSETTIDAESEVVISKLDTTGATSQVSLRVWTGSIWNKVKSLLNIDDQYEVETPTAVMGVRGTLYLVNVDGALGSSTVGVMDGAVADRQNQGEAEDSQEHIVFMGEELNQTIEGSASDKKQPINLNNIIAKVQPQIMTNVIKDVTSRAAELLSKAKAAQSNYNQSKNPELIKGALVLAEKALRLIDLGKDFVGRVKLSDKVVIVNEILKESNLSLDQFSTQLDTIKTAAVQVQNKNRQDAIEAGLSDEEINNITDPDVEDNISNPDIEDIFSNPDHEDIQPPDNNDNGGGGGKPTKKTVKSITVTGEGDVTNVEYGKSLQMSATVLPADATDKSVEWSVIPGTGNATIDATTGLLSATGIGTVTIKATNIASAVYGTLDLTVTPEYSSPEIVSGIIDNTNNIITLDLSQEIKDVALLVNEGEVPWAVSLTLTDNHNYWVGIWGKDDVVPLQKVEFSGEKLVLNTNEPIYGQYTARLCIGKVSKSEFNKQSELALTLNGKINGIAKLSNSTDHNGIKIEAMGTTQNGQSVTISTETHEDGSFILNDLPEGQYLLEASKSGYQKTNEVVDVIGGKTIYLESDMVLYPQSVTGSVYGYAKFIDSQKHLGIVVHVQTKDGKLLPNLIAQTDDQGYFKFDAVPVDNETLQDTYILTAFTLNESLGYNSDSVQVTIQANETVGLPVTLWLRQSASNLIIFADDDTPWNQSALRDMLDNLKVDPEGTIYPSSAMSTLPLPIDKTVWIVNDQPQDFYNTYKDNQQKFDDFVKLGGTLLFEACDQGWNYGSMEAVGATLPGGVANKQRFDYTNINVNPSHPMMTGIPIKLYGSCASHDYFSNLPAVSTVLAEDTDNRPTLVEYKYEKGRVIATGQPLEFYWGQEGLGRIYSNMVYYTLNKPTSAGLVAPYFSLSEGDATVQPTRSQETLTYQAKVGHDVDMITITPSAESGKIIVNGNEVLSGQVSNPLYLAYGLNTMRIVVAEQGKLPKAYTVVVTREMYPSPILSADEVDNTTGNDMEVTFVDDPAWRESISEVQVDGSTISLSSCTVTSGSILLSGNLFPIARDYNIKVKAFGYSDASVVQTVIPPDDQPTVYAVSSTSEDAGSNKITVIFDRPMNNTGGALVNKKNWTIKLDDDNINPIDSNETTLTLTNSTMTYDKSKNELTIQLNEIKDGAYISPAKYIYVVPSPTKIMDLKGNDQIKPSYSMAMTEAETVAPAVDPHLVYVDFQHLRLNFSEPVNPALAVDINNYSLSGTDWFNGYPEEVTLGADKQSVILMVPDLSVFQQVDTLRVTVKDIQDLAGNVINDYDNFAEYTEVPLQSPYFSGSTTGKSLQAPTK